MKHAYRIKGHVRPYGGRKLIVDSSDINGEPQDFQPGYIPGFVRLDRMRFAHGERQYLQHEIEYAGPWSGEAS